MAERRIQMYRFIVTLSVLFVLALGTPTLADDYLGRYCQLHAKSARLQA